MNKDRIIDPEWHDAVVKLADDLRAENIRLKRDTERNKELIRMVLSYMEALKRVYDPDCTEKYGTELRLESELQSLESSQDVSKEVRCSNCGELIGNCDSSCWYRDDKPQPINQPESEQTRNSDLKGKIAVIISKWNHTLGNEYPIGRAIDDICKLFQVREAFEPIQLGKEKTDVMSKWDEHRKRDMTELEKQLGIKSPELKSEDE